jgi:hypothetical protein
VVHEQQEQFDRADQRHEFATLIALPRWAEEASLTSGARLTR